MKYCCINCVQSAEGKFYKGKHIKRRNYTFSSSSEIEATEEFKTALKNFKSYLKTKKLNDISIDEIKSYDPKTKRTKNGYKISNIFSFQTNATAISKNGSGVTLKRLNDVTLINIKMTTYDGYSSYSTVGYYGAYLKNDKICFEKIITFGVS